MKPPRLKLILVWLAVGLPLAWGVTKSAQKASPLFTNTPATPAIPAK